MDIVKKSGEFAGKAAGRVFGGSVRVIGELTGSSYVKEIGNSVERVTAATGKTLGEAVSGVLDAGTGLLTRDPFRRDEGLRDLGNAVSATAKGIWHGAEYVFDNSVHVAKGIYEGDADRLKHGLKQLGKVAAVGALAVGVFDLIDVDPASAEAEAPVGAEADADRAAAANVPDLGGVERIDTINASLEGETHPETGVPYESKIVRLSEDEYVQGVFPDFDEVYADTLPGSMYQASDYEQFAYMNERLAERVAADPAFASQFTEEQIAQILEGETPDGYVWHHAEEPGRMELVSEEVHAQSAHTGGRALWGGGSAYR